MIEKGDIFYGINVFQPGCMEINCVTNVINSDYTNSINVEVQPIIGTGGNYSFPVQYDFSVPIICVYHDRCVWIYGKNVDNIASINELLLSKDLNSSDFANIITWSVWHCCFRKDQFFRFGDFKHAISVNCNATMVELKDNINEFIKQLNKFKDL